MRDNDFNSRVGASRGKGISRANASIPRRGARIPSAATPGGNNNLTQRQLFCLTLTCHVKYKQLEFFPRFVCMDCKILYSYFAIHGFLMRTKRELEITLSRPLRWGLASASRGKRANARLFFTLPRDTRTKNPLGEEAIGSSLPHPHPPSTAV